MYQYFIIFKAGLWTNGTFNELWENLSSKMFGGAARFADMYYGLRVINCRGDNCQFKNNYGPLWEFLYLEFNLIFVFLFF